ncbi:zf-HC2 domain-containing protein [Streptomyces sp. YU58]|uniref:zf-HC2 domain-containing protein n=1 Tax=Streptomyces sp. SX92 TaxID=3158972 RepID=UPI0027B969D3|nr:zf-HC2 domain-containing protein [Streptomyces coralus]WLW54942.1 zf-HC2 domain-containing protein [Streptomyces coralus]
MTDWHAPDDLALRYADGSLPEADAWSLEKHLEHCTPCATRVSRAVRETAAGVVLAEVRESVLGAAPAYARETVPGAAPADTRKSVLGAAPAATRKSVLRPAPAPRPASATGAGRTPATRPDRAPQTGPVPASTTAATAPAPAMHRPSPPAHAPAPGTPAPTSPRARLWSYHRLPLPPLTPRLARVLWAAGPALRGAWLSAVLIVAVGAVVLAYGAGYMGVRPLLLAVAPVVPVIGVALSYGAYADPLHEITASTPSAGLRLVLVRVAAVLAVSLPLLTLAGVLVPSSGAPGAAAWLLPGLALTLASLALAGYVGCPAATAVTGGGWLCAVLAPALAAPGGRLTARLADQLSTVLDGAPAQGAWAAAAVLSAVALAVRRPAYDHLGRP